MHHPRINQAARYVADVANAAGVRAYDEKTGDGHLRYAQLTAVASAERGAAHLDEDATVQVALVWNGRPPVVGASMPAALRRFIDALVGGDVDSALLHGVWVNFNDSSTNEIVSADSKNWRHAHGPAYQWSRHGDARVCYAPGSFLQANTEAYNALLSAVRRHVPAGRAVSELYAGAGAIGLSLAASETSGDSFSLRCVEIVEAARETFDLSARETLGMAPRGTRVWRTSRSASPPPPTPPPRRCAGADAVVVDPPRKGLDARTLAALAGHDPAFTNVYGRSGKPLEASEDPRHGKQGAAGSGRKKRNKRNRRAKKKRDVNGVVDPSSLSTTPPPPPIGSGR